VEDAAAHEGPARPHELRPVQPLQVPSMYNI